MIFPQVKMFAGLLRLSRLMNVAATPPEKGLFIWITEKTIRLQGAKLLGASALLIGTSPRNLKLMKVVNLFLVRDSL